MGTGLLSTVFGGAACDPGAETFYECTGCGATFGEWQAPCSECGRLVVRIVEPQSPGGV